MAISTFAELKLAVGNWLGREELTNRIPEYIAMAEDRIALDLRVQAMETSAWVVWKATTTVTTVGGTANAITLTPASAAASYALGDTYKFTAASSNTAATTVNVSSLGAKTIKRRHGGVKQDLAADDIISGVDYRIYYDGTDFLLVPPGGAPLPSNFLEQVNLYLDTSSEKSIDFMMPSVFWGRNAVNETSMPDIYTVEGDYIVLAPIPDGTYRGRLQYYRRFTSLSAASDTNWILSNARGLLLYGALLEAYIYLEDDAGTSKYAALFDQILDANNKAAKRTRVPRGAQAMRSQVSVV